jgi:hypothetical protein
MTEYEVIEKLKHHLGATEVFMVIPRENTSGDETVRAIIGIKLTVSSP